LKLLLLVFIFNILFFFFIFLFFFLFVVLFIFFFLNYIFHFLNLFIFLFSIFQLFLFDDFNLTPNFHANLEFVIDHNLVKAAMDSWTLRSHKVYTYSCFSVRFYCKKF